MERKTYKGFAPATKGLPVFAVRHMKKLNVQSKAAMRIFAPYGKSDKEITARDIHNLHKVLKKIYTTTGQLPNNSVSRQLMESVEEAMSVMVGVKRFYGRSGLSDLLKLRKKKNPFAQDFYTIYAILRKIHKWTGESQLYTPKRRS